MRELEETPKADQEDYRQYQAKEEQALASAWRSDRR